MRGRGRSIERALAIREKALGPEHPDTATSLNNLAFLLTDQGDLAGARPLFERALAIREKALGPEHPDTAMSLNNLAVLLQDQGDLAGARPLYRARAGDLRKGARPRASQTPIARAAICPACCFVIGHPTEALALGETALAAHDKALGPDHAWTKDSARVTADALDALGRAEEAKALRERYRLTPPEKPQSS